MPRIRDDLPRLKRVFLYTLLFSLAAHAYMYLSLAPSHDSLYAIVAFDRETPWQISLGRFMQPVYWAVRGHFPVPWLVGCLATVYLAAGVYLLFSVLHITGRLPMFLLCGIFAANITMTTSVATYIPWADVSMLALLLVCAGVYLWERAPRWGAWAAIPLFSLSMGLYQAYIDVAIGMALLLLICRIAAGQRFSALWRQALRYAVSLLCGALLYYGLMALSLRLTRVELADGNNGLMKLFTGSPGEFLALLPAAYRYFFTFFSARRGYEPAYLRLLFAALTLLGAAGWAVLLRRRHIRGLELAAFFLCLALLPLGLDFVYILAMGDIHSLMTYSFQLVYVLLLLPFFQKAEPPRKIDGGMAGSGLCSRCSAGASFSTAWS